MRLAAMRSARSWRFRMRSHFARQRGERRVSDIVPPLVLLWCIAALVAHVIACVATNWAAMLIAGLVFFPVGIVHGTGVIFGWW